tara:strand:+ start:12595 stop:13230 length:636 start_codon:yes stop_codon:yes gene_type:complete
MSQLQPEIVGRRGIFGFGFSLNDNLDLMNLVVLACLGIVIKVFFQEGHTKLGNMGPASTNIWGYGLTALALFLMSFMSLYFSKKTTQGYLEEGNIFTTLLNLLFNDTLIIALTLALILYVIYINFSYYTRINSNLVADSFHTYSFYSSFLLIVQIAIIVKYMFNKLDSYNGKGDTQKQDKAIKALSYILLTINFIFVMITHILLSFFSTDG